MIKGQNPNVVVGMFILLFGLSILLYWLTMPQDQKSTIFYDSLTTTQRDFDVDVNVSPIVYLSNVMLSKNKILYVISDKETIGDYIETNYMYLGDINLSTSFLRGPKNAIFSIPYDDTRYDGVKISGVILCNNCRYEIIINGVKIAEGSEDGPKSFIVTREDILSKNTSIHILLNPSKNIFKYSTLEIKGLKIFFLKKSYIEFPFFVPNGTRVYLLYNFCPSKKEAVEFIINNIYNIRPASCSSDLYNNPLELTQYLSSGWNKLIIKSEVPINITSYLEVSSSKLYFVFPKPKLGVVNIVFDGKGYLLINNKRFLLDRNQTYINIKNYLKPRNIMIVEPLGELYIYYIEIT